jgi:hypothetical protein
MAFSEIALHSMASYIERNCPAAVVFTGNYGGTVWDVNLDQKYMSDQLKHQSLAGNGLIEIRLKSGFFQVGVPYILGRSQMDVIAIGLSPELEPWRLHNSYDRPVPRRILETAGVDRNLFGRRKIFLMDSYMWPINTGLRKKFFKYLRENQDIKAWQVYLYFNVASLANILQVALKKEKAFSLKKLQRRIFSREVDLYYLMNHWAKQVLSDKTARVLFNRNNPSS